MRLATSLGQGHTHPDELIQPLSSRSTGRIAKPFDVLLVRRNDLSHDRAMSGKAPLQSELKVALLGSWVGTLEYRDYSDDSREKLGTLLRVYRAPKTGRLIFRYVYDDGPTKVVQDQDEIELDEATSHYRIYSKDGGTPDDYLIVGLKNLASDGTGALTLLGKGTENNVAVAIREKLFIGARSLRIVRESQLVGQPFKFRHEFRFERVATPSRT